VQSDFCVTAYGGIKGENCMKNWKHWVFLAIIAIFGIAIAFIACDESKNDPCKCDPKDHLQVGQSCDCGGENCDCTVEQPKDQSGTITNLFDKGYNVTVNGYFTNTEWGSGATGVVGRIGTVITARYDTAGESVKNRYDTIFGRGVIVIVEASPNGYPNWKCIGDGKTIYLSFAAINDADFYDILGTAIANLYSNGTGWNN
jgi:hypothetical protein